MKQNIIIAVAAVAMVVTIGLSYVDYTQKIAKLPKASASPEPIMQTQETPVPQDATASAKELDL